MLDALIMRPVNTVVFLWPPDGPSYWRVDPATAPSGWEIRTDVVLDPVPKDLGHWPHGSDMPPVPALCVSTTDEKRFRVFKDPRGIDGQNFRDTGWHYGGFYAATPSLWEGLLEQNARMMERLAEPDDDPPGAMNEVLQNLRRVR